MVERLGGLLKGVSVALVGVHFRGLVEVDHASLGGEVGNGRDLSEFVPVTGGDDVGLGVKSEDLADEVLQG